MKKNELKKRVLAFLLAAVMALSAVPINAIPTQAVTPESRVTDTATHTSWKQFFNLDKGELTTQNAGMVWTDKSVFTKVPDVLKELYELDSKSAVSVTMDAADKDNFLVMLSAMASNKTITGYSTIPTDTVFVLDLSSSMQRNDNRGGSAIDELVDETNAAITRLLALNNHNRVGVVLYAGNTKASWGSADAKTMAILPLDRYTAGTNGAFLVSTSNDRDVEVADNVKNSKGNNMSGSMSSSTGTYTQAGILKAVDQFENADPTIPDGMIQGGTVRQPIMVLMSDGEPTLANPNFTELGQSVMAYSRTSYTAEQDNRNAIAFLTQLTAMYANAAVEDHYGKDLLFYTLTYGDAATNRPEAMSVMNPAQTSSALNTLWTTMQNNGKVQVYKYGNGKNDIYYAQKNDYVAEGNEKFEGRVYVDKFYPSNNDADFSSAFQAIVDEIVLQSRYTPTLVSSGLHDLDGYISFVDHIGEHMEVTDIKGMVIGNHYYSGAAFSHYITSGAGGTVENPSNLGDEFVYSVKERLGISDTATAQALIQQAYNHGQIAFTSNSDYSNYIGWYSNANGKFIGFWYDGITTAVPDGATHINKSYGFLGEADEAHGVHQTDMMYTTVRIREEIETGDVTLAWAIPASLIPTLTYEVQLGGETYGSEMVGITTTGATAPISLVYEVALDEDIHDYNIHEIVQGVPGHENHMQEGKYVFYSNDWNAKAENDTNTYSYFEASKENEYYYYVSDAVIYTDEAGNNKCTTKPDPNGIYYHEYYVYSKENGTQRTMIRIAPSALADAKQDGNNWVIPKDTAYQLLTTRQRAKNPNATATMPYIVWPVIDKDPKAEYHTAAVLGNNGKLTVTPATGLKITKTVTETVENAENTFTFVISGGSDAAKLVRPGKANGSDDITTLTFNNGKAEFTIAADETVYITGLAAGNAYTVFEKGNTNYAVETIKVGGAKVDAAEITLTAGQMQTVDFVNAPKGYGNLNITKEITPAEGHVVPASIMDEEFELTITMEGLANQTFKVVHSDNKDLNEITTNGDGKVEGIKIKHGETIQIQRIPEDTNVTIAEDLTGKTNFKVTYVGDVAPEVEHCQATISKSLDTAVVIKNQYTPTSTTVDLNIAGTKNFNNETGKEQTFTFKVQKWNGTAWEYIKDKDGNDLTGSVSYIVDDSDKEKEFAINNILDGITYDKPGEYAYQVVEVIPENKDGIVYDRATHTITVKVEDIEGQLTASVSTHNADITPDNNKTFVVNPKFHNYYHYDIVSIDLTKILSNDSGSNKVNLSGYEFVLKEGDEVVAQESSDAAGEARMVLTYNSEDVGTHTYTLEEIKPTADPIPNMQYTTTVYTITVEVTVAENNAVSAKIISISGGRNTQEEAPEINEIKDNAIVRFANIYTPVQADLVLEANKVLTGRDLAAGEFKFAIYEDGKSKVEGATPVATGTNNEEGIITFSQMTFAQVGTYKYDVVEIADSLGGVTYDETIYDLVVEVTDNGGELAATYFYEDATGTVVTFNNSYNVKPASLTLGGKKTLTDRNLLAGEFKFQLKNAAGEILQTVENAGYNAGGVFNFAPITYTAEGTYTYTISEMKGNLTGVKYDETVHTVTVKVTDNGVGKLVAKIGDEEVTEKKDYNFANTFTPQEISYTLSGTKILNGKALEADAYTFVLADKGGNIIEYAYNDESGAFSFEELTFNKIGTYEYKVYELASSEPGMTYDNTVYDVIIEVTYSSETGAYGKTVTVKNGEREVESISFENSYAAPVAVNLEAAKKLSGRNLKADEFSFNLTDVASGEIIQTITNDADGKIAFNELYFQEAGTYYYTIQENVPVVGEADYDPLINYDAKTINVTVTITLDETANVFETNVNYGTDNNVAEFNNSFTPTPASVELSGTKTLDGRNLVEKEFSFQLVDEAGAVKQTVQNDADGKFAFEKMTFAAAGTYKYTVSEVAGDEDNVVYDTTVYTVTVVVTQDEVSGKLSATTAIDNGGRLVFANTYDPDAISVEVKGSKSLRGRDMKAGEFEFILDPEAGHFSAMTRNDEEGNFSFSLSFSEAGEYKYRLYEKAGIAPGVTYDDTEYYFIVQVTADPATGKLQSNIVFTDDAYEEKQDVSEIVFANEYDPDATNLVVEATKKLTGRAMKAGEFEFILTQEGNPFSAMTVNDVQGKVNFNLIFNDAGEYHYTISEKQGSDKNMTYDETKYFFTVVVTDTGNGTLETQIVFTDETWTEKTDVEEMVFQNTFTPDPTSVKLEGTKTLDGRNLVEKEFSFQLVDEAGAVKQTVQNDADGKFAFEEMTFATAGTYKYTVSEVAGDDDNVVYDTTVYSVTVAVTKDEVSGKLSAEVSIDNGGKLDFHNTYEPDDPDAVCVLIKGDKVLTGRAMLAGEFKFVLTQEGDPVPVIAVNDAFGNFAFNLSFDEAGEYHYTVREMDGVAPGMAYDNAVYYFTVVVTESDEGKLETEIIFTDATGTKKLNIDKMIFRNVFTPKPVDVELEGTKTLIGKNLKAGEFHFQLKDINGKLLQVVKNDANGKFAFDELEFKTAGTYVYYISEAAGNDDNVVYDTTIYKVTVVVTKDPITGMLIAKTTVNHDGKIAFTNTYEPDEIKVEVEGTKKLTGREMKAGEFQFVLTQDGNSVPVVAGNDAEGNFAFTLRFNKTGEYKYSLYEKAGSAPGVTYDDTVYDFVVKVTADPETGELKADIVKDAAQIVFENTYDPDATNLVVEADKELTGRAMKNGEFEFVLTQEGNSFSAVTVNDAQGNIKFNLMFHEAGEYHYTLSEKAGNVPGVTYDDMAYYFTVVVTDFGNGTLDTKIIFTDETRKEEISVDKMIFRNTYHPDSTSVELKGTKTLSGKELEKDAFSFQLKDKDGKVLQTVKNAADGSITFAALEFSEVGTYTYTVAEIKGDDETITYDETVYTVTVVVSDDNGVLRAVVTVDNGGELAFSNAYVPEVSEEPTEPTEPTQPTEPTEPGNGNVPDTRDGNHVMLWVLLAGFSMIGALMLNPFKRKGRYSD